MGLRLEIVLGRIQPFLSCGGARDVDVESGNGVDREGVGRGNRVHFENVVLGNKGSRLELVSK